MTKSIRKVQKVSSRAKKSSLLGLSMVSLSGFRTCQMVDEKISKVSSDRQKTLKEIVCYKKER